MLANCLLASSYCGKSCLCLLHKQDN